MSETAVTLKQIDKDWVHAKYLMFRDEGLLNRRSVTRRFSVHSRISGAALGYIRWKAQWRKYIFAPFNAEFDDGCLQELAAFLEHVTFEQKSRTKILWVL